MNPLSLNEISFHPQLPATLHNGHQLQRHPRFFFEDGNVIFLVERALYKVHRYFFKKDSPVFDSMFSLPQPDGHAVEGQSEDSPIVLPHVQQHDFDLFLTLLYPQRVLQVELQAVAEWMSVLSLSTLWSFDAITMLAIANLYQISTPVEKIVLGRRYGDLALDPTIVQPLAALNPIFATPKIPYPYKRGESAGPSISLTNVHTWLMPSFMTLVERREPLTMEEGLMLGVEDVIRINQTRETVRHFATFNRDQEGIRRLVAVTLLPGGT